MNFKVNDNKTGKEADEYRIALREEWARSLCYCDMDGFALMQDGSLILVDECGRYEYCPEGRFSIAWNAVTNADRIRNMDDVELATFLYWRADGSGNSQQEWLNWLIQEGE